MLAHPIARQVAQTTDFPASITLTENINDVLDALGIKEIESCNEFSGELPGHRFSDKNELIDGMKEALETDPTIMSNYVVKTLKNSIIVTEEHVHEGIKDYKPLSLLGILHPGSKFDKVDQEMADKLVMAGQKLVCDDIGMECMPLLLTNGMKIVVGAVKWESLVSLKFTFLKKALNFYDDERNVDQANVDLFVTLLKRPPKPRESFTFQWENCVVQLTQVVRIGPYSVDHRADVVCFLDTPPDMTSEDMMNQKCSFIFKFSKYYDVLKRELDVANKLPPGVSLKFYATEPQEYGYGQGIWFNPCQFCDIISYPIEFLQLEH